MCDMTGTSLMYLGLTMTYASVFQMLRGSVVIFTGILSVLFLKRRLYGFHWLGMFLVLVGAAIVGLASVLFGKSDDSKDSSKVLLGNVIIIVAQIVVAVQMVVEEKFLTGYRIPALQAVGWEGLWGLSIICCVLVGMQFIKVNGDPVEDSYDAMVQLSNSKIIIVATLGNVCSIAGFNFFGISVTQAMSASHRMVLDSVRTIVVWAVSLAVGWEDFSWLQVLGFLVLLSGTVVYNELVRVPGMEYPEEEYEEGAINDATEKLLPEGGDKEEFDYVDYETPAIVVTGKRGM